MISLFNLSRKFGWLLRAWWRWKGWRRETSGWVAKFTIFFRWVSVSFLQKDYVERAWVFCTFFFGGNVESIQDMLCCLPPKKFVFRLSCSWNIHTDQVGSCYCDYCEWVSICYALFRSIKALQIPSGNFFLSVRVSLALISSMLRLTSLFVMWQVTVMNNS